MPEEEVKKEAKKEETKSGYKTTEFWLTVIAEIVGLLILSGVVTPDGDNLASKIIAGAIVALGALGYQTSRTKAKAKKENG